MAEQIEVPLGETFEVGFQALAPAGYTWHLDPVQGGESVEYVRESWEPPPARTVGGPSRQVFQFRAVRPGIQRIRFVYRRSWEAEPKESRQVLVRVT